MNAVKLNPVRVAYALLLLSVGLMGLHVVSYAPVIAGTRDEAIYFLNMDQEQNLAALISAAMLWMVGGLAFAIAAVTMSGWLKRIQWTGLGSAFIFLGIDESTSLHERLIHPLRDGLGLTGVLHFAWVLPYTILLVVFVIIYARFFFNLPRDTRWRLLFGGGVYVGGALGFEFVDGLWASRHGVDDGVYAVLVTIEESLELIGCVALVYAFLMHIARHLPGFKVSIETVD